MFVFCLFQLLYKVSTLFKHSMLCLLKMTFFTIQKKYTEYILYYQVQYKKKTKKQNKNVSVTRFSFI